VPVSAISQVISLCKSLTTLLQGEVSLEYSFVFALVWALGGCLGEKDGIDYRKEFSSWWKNAWKSAVKFPSKGTIFDYFVDTSGDGCRFSEWASQLTNAEFDTFAQQMGQVTVQTSETLAISTLIHSFIAVRHPSLLIGGAGCGKTQISKGILREVLLEHPEQFSF